jgi:hypothetical protein
VGEDDVARPVDVLAYLQAGRGAPEQFGELVLSLFDRDADQIASIKLQEIEGVKVGALLDPIPAP